MLANNITAHAANSLLKTVSLLVHSKHSLVTQLLAPEKMGEATCRQSDQWG